MDDSVLEKIAAGDGSAVQECLDRYGNLVWSLARRFTANAADAEEAVQDIFVEVWSSAARYDRSVAKEATFIATIARRRLIDRLRKKGREPGMSELAPDAAVESPTVQEDLEVQQEASRVLRLVGTLRPEQQTVLKLSIYEGISHRQIAERLDMPIGTVKTHLRRGLISLRERLGVDTGARGGAPS